MEKIWEVTYFSTFWRRNLLVVHFQAEKKVSGPLGDIAPGQIRSITDGFERDLINFSVEIERFHSQIRQRHVVYKVSIRSGLDYSSSFPPFVASGTAIGICETHGAGISISQHHPRQDEFGLPDFQRLLSSLSLLEVRCILKQIRQSHDLMVVLGFGITGTPNVHTLEDFNPNAGEDPVMEGMSWVVLFFDRGFGLYGL